MRHVLLAAAAYNVIWGLVAILSPLTIFRLAGFDPLPVYPQLWQCIGMIVGVYGIGYGIAAFNPCRHWPIVLVGLLGKIFGPIGFLSAVASGQFPAAMGWTILTNDLIWWVPFAVILWRAAEASQFRSEWLSIPPARLTFDPFNRFVSQLGGTLHEVSSDKPALVVFLRHSGCTFCRETLGDLAGLREHIEAQGTRIVLIHMGVDPPTKLLHKYGLRDLHCFSDPHCRLYDYFGLNTGTFRQLFGFKVLLRGIKAFTGGHGIGALNGNGFRLPGVALIYRSRVQKVFRHRFAAERPDYVKLASPPPQPETRTANAMSCDTGTQDTSACGTGSAGIPLLQ
ncbi:MAG: SelL-related redox protein [Fuerstiella sp.]